MKSEGPRLPRIPSAFFRWYCRNDRFEEIHGDLEEFFRERCHEKGYRNAQWAYFLDVIRCCRPYAWKNTLGQNTQLVMFKNYYKTSLRSMLRNPLSSFINVLGLSIAIGICLVAYVFMEFDYRIDHHHELKDEVFATTFYADREGESAQYGFTPRPLGKGIVADIPQVVKACRIQDQEAVVKFGNQVFHERLRLVDPSFLDMLTFPLSGGTKATLREANNVIISHEMAIKYFGSEEPLGQDLLVIVGERSKRFKVTGVAKPFPEAHIIDFDFLVNFENNSFFDLGYEENDWASFLTATLIQAKPEDIEEVKSFMDPYVALHNDVNTEWKIEAYDFASVADLHHASATIRNGISYDGRAPGRITLPIIALMMLALACFNYINMAIVSSSKRLKEIGMRKVMGANRRKVIVQFLVENTLLTSIAVFTGVLLAIFVILPWFNEIAEVPFRLRFTDLNLWLFSIGLTLFTGLASGIYPAFYISKFESLSIFRGNLKFGRKSRLTQVFLGIQLALACILITCAVAYHQNTQYQIDRSWGYEQKGALYATLAEGSDYVKLRDQLEQLPYVTYISGSAHHLGKDHLTTVVQVPGRDYEVEQMKVGEGYFETMGLKLLLGRSFRDKGDEFQVVINETMQRKMGWRDPIGQTFKISEVSYRVIGVVKDFHSYSFYRLIRPTFFTWAPTKDFNYLALQVEEGKQEEAYRQLKEEWSGLFPEEPFQGEYQSQVWGSYFLNIAEFARFNRGVATVAMLLASLGLYGLIALNISGRVKEFSIRKALGARLKHLTHAVSKQFFWLTAIALVVGSPLSYWAAGAQMDIVFSYRLPMSVWPVLVAMLILVLTMAIVIGALVKRVFVTNPVDGLRTE